MEQQSLSMIGYYYKGKKTRREQFLAQMDKVVPWQRLLALIEPHYPKGSPAGGRQVLRFTDDFMEREKSLKKSLFEGSVE